MTNTEIPEEAVEAAAKVSYQKRFPVNGPWELQQLAYQEHWREHMQAALEAALPALRKQWATEAAQAIDKRRLSRRGRWLRHRRWSAEAEKFWSLGMWDAMRVLREYGETTP